MVAEILNGELFTTSLPGRRHTRAASIMGGVLGGAFWYGRSRRLGDPSSKPELHLGPSRTRWCRISRGGGAIGCPTSLDRRTRRRTTKCRRTGCVESCRRAPRPGTAARKWRPRREGIPHLWLINPLAKQLEVYHLESGRYSLLDTFWDDAVVRADPFGAIESRWELLWGSPRRP